MESGTQPVERLRAAAVRVTYGSSPRSKTARQPQSLHRITGSSVAFPVAANTTISSQSHDPSAKRQRVADAEICLAGGDSSEEESDGDSKGRRKGAVKRQLVQTSLFSKRPAAAECHAGPRCTSVLDQCLAKKKQGLRSVGGIGAGPVGQQAAKREQTFLDFGQKPIAPDPCKQCGMAFQRGRKDDEELHSRYHRSWARKQLRLLVWNVCAESSNAPRASDIVVVDYQSSTKRELRRGLEIINAVNDYLGAVKLEPCDLEKKQRKLFLHVSSLSSRVDGCILAEMIDGASRLVVEDAGQPIACLDSVLPATCGISRIWVAPDARRTGVASRLIDAVRMHFIYGCSIPLDKIAFTQPTADGLALGTRIFGRKDFLVYTET